MKQWILALGSLLMMSSGCKPIVLEPLKSDNSSVVVVGGHDALAMRYGDWIPPSPGASSFFNFSVNPPQDPDALMLFFSDVAEVCGQPVQLPATTDCESKAFNQLILIIPPALDRPGLIDLTDGRITGYEGEGLAMCGGGTGSTPGLRGTLEIVSSDATSLSVKLRVGPHQAGWVSLDDDYTAQRCDAAPPASPPSPALAMLGQSLPVAPSGGAMPDPKALFVFLGSAAETCQDPWSPVDCTQTGRLSLSLPPSLQKPGIIDLSDPAIAATYSISVHDGAPNCSAVSGAPTQGTIEILSIDANALAFKVYGSATSLDKASGPLGDFTVDGLYAASLCP